MIRLGNGFVMKPMVFAILCTALVSCSARQPTPSPSAPLDISLNGALGFRIGATLDAVRVVATSHGDQLKCWTREDLQFCSPLRIPGERGYYTVVLSADSVSSVSFQLRSWPDARLPVIEDEIERIAVPRAAGHMTDDGRGYIKIWTNTSWTRQILTICDNATDTDCDLAVSAVEPHNVQARAASINARQ